MVGIVDQLCTDFPQFIHHFCTRLLSDQSTAFPHNEYSTFIKEKDHAAWKATTPTHAGPAGSRGTDCRESSRRAKARSRPEVPCPRRYRSTGLPILRIAQQVKGGDLNLDGVE